MRKEDEIIAGQSENLSAAPKNYKKEKKGL